MSGSEATPRLIALGNFCYKEDDFLKASEAALLSAIAVSLPSTPEAEITEKNYRKIARSLRGIRSQAGHKMLLRRTAKLLDKLSARVDQPLTSPFIVARFPLV